jgi:hypothetical protein
VTEEALAHWGLLRQKQTNKQTNCLPSSKLNWFLLVIVIAPANAFS